MAPATMQPCIPVYIRNTFKPLDPGSCITTRELAESGGDGRSDGSGGSGGNGVSSFYDCARGFSTVDHMSLINVEGSGMIGVPGIAQRLFSSLHAHDISVTLIAQASSEHSICIAVRSDQTKEGKYTLLFYIFVFFLYHNLIFTLYPFHHYIY